MGLRFLASVESTKMDDTASLSSQFSISVCNPIQAENGYSRAPYSILEYPDIGMLSANGFGSQYNMPGTARVNNQFNHVIPREESFGSQSFIVIDTKSLLNAQVCVSVDSSYSLNSSAFTVIDREFSLNNSIFTEIDRDSLGGMQFICSIDTLEPIPISASTVINRDHTLNNSIFTEIDRDALGGMQFLVSIDETSNQNAQSTFAIKRTQSFRSSVFIVINRSRNLRCQIYSRRITLNRLATQYYFKSPYETAFHSEGYCTSPWPSTCWPYIDMFAWRLSHQTLWVLSHRPALSTQFRVSVAAREQTNFQVTGIVVKKYNLNSSITIPLWDFLENARPVTRSQFNITQGANVNMEVRWRPF
jgi:hypothetical protein